MMEFVNGKDDIPYIFMENQKMKIHQPVMICYDDLTSKNGAISWGYHGDLMESS